ncbi:MAG: SH3 domain-containing protein [Chloroflexota bacterium]|nr:SH3 domain-containing protein [Chloroflexota bacterium]
MTDADPLVATAAVNLRAAPGTDCPVVTVLDPGTRIVPRGAAVGAGGRVWVPIQVVGDRGWVAAEFLRPANR